MELCMKAMPLEATTMLYVLIPTTLITTWRAREILRLEQLQEECLLLISVRG
jgi:hypothetical protein